MNTNTTMANTVFSGEMVENCDAGDMMILMETTEQGSVGWGGVRDHFDKRTSIGFIFAPAFEHTQIIITGPNVLLGHLVDVV